MPSLRPKSQKCVLPIWSRVCLIRKSNKLAGGNARFFGASSRCDVGLQYLSTAGWHPDVALLHCVNSEEAPLPVSPGGRFISRLA